MARLYELTEEMERLQAMLEESEELPEDLWDAAQVIQGAYEDKLAGYAKILRNMQAERDAILAERDRLDAKAARIQRSIDWLKSNVLHSMQRLGIRKVATTIGNWNIRKNPMRLVIDDPKKLADGWLIPQEPKVDKAALRHYLIETGEIITGAHLEQDEGVTLR